MFVKPYILPLKNRTKLLSLVCLLALCFVFTARGQEPLRVKYNFIIDDGDKEGSKITIERDGQKWRIRDGNDGKNYIDLDYQHEYLLTFSKPGYVTKKIFISTKVPKNLLQDGFNPYPFDLYLYKQVEGVNIVIFNQPVARIIFKADIDDFDYDTDYTKSVLSRVQEADNTLKQKNKENNANKKPNENSANTNPPNQSGKPPAEGTKNSKNEEGGPSSETIGKYKSEEGTVTPEQANKNKNQAGKKTPGATEGEKKGNLKGATGGDNRGNVSGATGGDSRGNLKGATDGENKNNITAKTEGENRDKKNGNIVVDNENKNRMLPVKTLADNDGGSANSKIPDNRAEKQYVEGNKRITEITISRKGKTYIYKKVIFIWGVFYFRDNTSITEATFIQEAL